jgi:hypothetical protein
VLFFSYQRNRDKFLRASYIGRHQQAAFTSFATSEQYLGSAARVPLAANASLSRYLICHPIFGLKFASRINFILRRDVLGARSAI